MMRYEINTFEDLKTFVLSNDLSKEQLKEVILKTLKVFIVGNEDKTALMIDLENFIKEHPNIKRRPFFLENPLLNKLK